MPLYGSGARGVETPLLISALVATLASNFPSLPFSKMLSNHGLLGVMRHPKQSFILRVSFPKLGGRVCADQPEHLEGATFRFAPHRIYATISASRMKFCKR
jgi:hypothetical protein